ncbi:Shedu anti-phage system protein SduA domain-containing protein [Klebsiella michiganensis]|uniref:Shedu anti-phage system protein SduA domain-containing protein n=1 Tax=Klebsiella michiganensis TaxID=1134687 RepID=UPI0006676D08|nr:DUF4263 domain-containing protein [Klebsiella michiganensis]MBS0927814.1 DUF4263 domain-containing protein [Klebsiella michiganensis]
MDLKDFSILCKERLDFYFESFERAMSKGYIKYNNKVINQAFYPTILLCVESDKRILSFELLGWVRARKSLKIKLRDNISVEQLTKIDRNKNNAESLFTFDNSDKCVLSNLMFRDQEAIDYLDSQGHVMAEKFSAGFTIGGNVSHLMDFKGVSSCMFFNCIISYVNNHILRARYINALVMFDARLDEGGILDRLVYFIRKETVFGVQHFSDETELSWVKASHLISLVLNDKIHETTIGDYINDHPDILLKSLGYSKIIYEPNLEWLEKTSDNPDLYINPDALLERNDGYYDICDFKKGLVKKKSITKGERRRRRFIDGVGEGLAQLDNYEEYFTYASNAQHALERYGVKVNSPRKILIIGNIENTKRVEVEEALRGRTDTIVIDYDSLISAYIGAIK